MARLQSQCFGYDGRNRLTSAYTIAHTATCSSVFNATAAPAPYNERYTYNTVGNITTFGTRDPGMAAETGINKYTYPAVTAARPHAPTQIVTTGGTDTYTYNPAGDRTGFR